MSEPEASLGPWLNKFVTDNINCPVCLVVPRDKPVHTCKFGHVICKSCFNSVGSFCPVCREGSLKTHCFRNLLAEQLLDLYNVNRVVGCRFDGCDFETRLPLLPAHEGLCLRRPCRCPGWFKGRCPFEGTLADLVKHSIDRSFKCSLVIYEKYIGIASYRWNFLLGHSCCLERRTVAEPNISRLGRGLY